MLYVDAFYRIAKMHKNEGCGPEFYFTDNIYG